MHQHNSPIHRPHIGPLVVVLILFATPTLAQLPEAFTNLEILPKDIDQRQLIGTMRGFSMSLGVRCTHCHVGEEGKPLSTFDFAADDKEPKRVARAMLRMTREINDQLLPATGRATTLEVGCGTCHHGVTRPTTLTQELTQALDAEGVDAAVARYRALRAEYHGRGVYDFGPMTLDRMAESLIAETPASAIALLRLNLDAHPDDAYGHYLLGESLAKAGDRPGAIGSFERSLALRPDNPRARARIEALKGESE